MTHEHVQQADGQAHAQAAEQEAHEHRAWPRVFDQQQVNA
jgi:hypothetical protein